jgi:hypothetical protein
MEAWEPEPAYRLKKRWYGWQTLLGLAGTDLFLIGGGFALESVPPIVFGYFSRQLVPPIVHWSNGHFLKGAASLGLNAGMPVAMGALAGLISSAGDNRNCGAFGCGAGFAIGAFIGSFIAPIIDIAALSTDEVRVPVKDAKFRPQSLALVPLLGSGRAGLALAGQL